MKNSPKVESFKQKLNIKLAVIHRKKERYVLLSYKYFIFDKYELENEIVGAITNRTVHRRIA